MGRENPARIAERVARDAVQRVIGAAGVVSELPTDAADFEIRYSDGRFGLGEVKFALDAATQAIWAKLLARKGSHQRVPMPPGTGRWMVRVRVDSNVEGLRKRLPALLLKLRARGVSEYSDMSWMPSDNSEEEFNSLGVRSVERIDGDADECVLFPDGIGGAVPSDANGVAEWIVDYLAARNHQAWWRRLRDPTLDESHVFVFIGSGAPESVQIRVGEHPDVPPTASPATPSWLTHLWIGTSVAREGTHHVWLYRPEAGWTNHPIEVTRF